LQCLFDNGAHALYVADFVSPNTSQCGLHWSDIDFEWMSWTPKQFIEALDYPLAEVEFKSDMNSRTNAKALVLVMA